MAWLNDILVVVTEGLRGRELEGDGENIWVNSADERHGLVKPATLIPYLTVITPAICRSLQPGFRPGDYPDHDITPPVITAFLFLRPNLKGEESGTTRGHLSASISKASVASPVRLHVINHDFRRV